ncbi:hypothetical protein R3P93_13370 [Rhodococcus cerastii]|uniref:Uncharacterized protein n=1 Tax=Rhodococcus cerastii TaxID=908616 RepID=A0ABU4D1H4_9NOCA|nr:hypothetical protein [Rhodococcus cerastii]MDV6303550.1 hypothetical protein [Rhodococcus cerastii]
MVTRLDSADTIAAKSATADTPYRHGEEVGELLAALSGGEFRAASQFR